MSVYIPEGFLLHPFQLWIWKAKLTTPILNRTPKKFHKLAEEFSKLLHTIFLLGKILATIFRRSFAKKPWIPILHQAPPAALWLKRFTSLSKCSPVPVSGLILPSALVKASENAHGTWFTKLPLQSTTWLKQCRTGFLFSRAKLKVRKNFFQVVAMRVRVG